MLQHFKVKQSFLMVLDSKMTQCLSVQQQTNEGFVCVVLQIFPAVLRALKSGAARLALTQELGDQVKGNKAMLEHQQFELVVKLLNCALLVSFSIVRDGDFANFPHLQIFWGR